MFVCDELNGRTSGLVFDVCCDFCCLLLDDSTLVELEFPTFDTVRRRFPVAFVPGPARASTTWCQCLVSLFSGDSFFHLLTNNTQALHISPKRFSWIRKHLSNSFSYLVLSVNLDEDDFALHMQQPKFERYIFGLWKLNIFLGCEWFGGILDYITRSHFNEGGNIRVCHL